MRVARAIAAIGLCGAVLALAACGDLNPDLAPPKGPTTGTTASASPTASATPSASATSEAAAKVGECFSYSSIEHLVLDSAEPHVSCDQPHTAQTVLVGELASTPTMTFADAQALLPQVNGPGGLASLPEDLQSQYLELMAALADTRKACEEAIDAELGLVLRDGTRQASLFRADLTGPTPTQWEGGDRWVRCNLVAVAGDGSTLVPFVDPLADLMTATATYRPCWTGTPAEQSPLSCSTDPAPRDAWLTLTDEGATPASAWPGEAQAQATAQAFCTRLARTLVTVPAPRVLSWATSTSTDAPTRGFSADTWGTPAGTIGCAVPLAQFPS